MSATGTSATTQLRSTALASGRPATALAYQNPRISSNGTATTESGYLTELLSPKAGVFLDQQTPAKPFLLTVTTPIPIRRMMAIRRAITRCMRRPVSRRRAGNTPRPMLLRGKEYLADAVDNSRKAASAITALDDQIPQLLAKLHQRGLRENTAVVVTSGSGVSARPPRAVEQWACLESHQHV